MEILKLMNEDELWVAMCELGRMGGNQLGNKHRATWEATRAAWLAAIERRTIACNTARTIED